MRIAALATSLALLTPHFRRSRAPRIDKSQPAWHNMRDDGRQ